MSMLAYGAHSNSHHRQKYETGRNVAGCPHQEKRKSAYIKRQLPCRVRWLRRRKNAAAATLEAAASNGSVARQTSATRRQTAASKHRALAAHRQAQSETQTHSPALVSGVNDKSSFSMAKRIRKENKLQRGARTRQAKNRVRNA